MRSRTITAPRKPNEISQLERSSSDTWAPDNATVSASQTSAGRGQPEIRRPLA
jgi:hypothetical protein